jgi:hypothetical protein
VVKTRDEHHEFRIRSFFRGDIAAQLAFALARGVYRLFLLLTSYVFYASFNAKFLLILLVFSFLTWFFAVIFAETSDARFRRFCVFLYAAFSLGILVFFKYYEMFYISADWLYRVFGAKSPVPLLDVIMPIGISFFTFQGMSYAIDVYRDPSKCERSLVEVLCFIAFFPTILSGPILRAGNFLPQLKKERVTGTDFNRAFFLLTRDWSKKSSFRAICPNTSYAAPLARPKASPRRRCWSASCPTPCRSTAIFPAIPIWPRVWPCSWASMSRTTSTCPMWP